MSIGRRELTVANSDYIRRLGLTPEGAVSVIEISTRSIAGW
jgi:hypothetical protein